MVLIIAIEQYPARRLLTLKQPAAQYLKITTPIHLPHWI